MWIILNDNDLLLHDVATGILLQHSPQHWDLASGSFSGNEPSKIHSGSGTKFPLPPFASFSEGRKARYSQIVTTSRLYTFKNLHDSAYNNFLLRGPARKSLIEYFLIFPA